ncbi:MAG: PP2C family protein-serine/threonine phosphatase [Clostridiales bacterium]|nr:PP2C family protein-serine/threonine phosphatase [Clostridiales bacterium]
MRLQKKPGLIKQITVLLLIGMAVISLLTYFTQLQLATYSVTRQMEDRAKATSKEVIDSVREYPAYTWLVKYWYEHDDELDIEYDVDYRPGNKTWEKCALLAEHHPELQLRYATSYQIERMSPQDQKLYAEIVYSWLITRINQIKRDQDIAFLFCVLTDQGHSENAYQEQYFLFSAAEPDSVRGTEYLQVYPIGVEVSVADNEEQQTAMRAAVERHEESSRDAALQKPEEHLALAGDYVDYYAYLMNHDGKAVLIGLTYDLSSMKSDIRHSTLQGTGLSLLYQVILLMILLLVLYMFALHPLEEIAKNIRQYTEVKDSEAVRTNLTDNLSGVSGYAVRRNEIGQLTDDVIGMTSEIDDYIDRIETISAEKERFAYELNLASRIQAAMMPSAIPAFPGRERFALHASMTPAREVGGDFYDYFPIDDDHLALVIADVSGKGIPAALFMMVSRIIIKGHLKNEKDPAKALEMTNSDICANNSMELFVTVWAGILEISTGKLTAANAGHEYPVLKEPDGVFSLIKDKHGFVIGGMDGMKYQNYEIRLTPGSRLFVYTDGVPEATNSSNELFGTERMLLALNSAGKEAEPERILETVETAVDAFTAEAEQFDDLTMLCVEYKG